MCASGGEPITALAKYKNEENFISQATMFLFCNEMPEIKGNDDGDAVKNRMVYVETKYSYLEKQKYEEMKNTNPKVRLADPTLKSEYLKRKEIQEAFVSLVCGAYVPEAPPLPECCIKKSLEYKPNKSLKKRLENIIDFTGDENDYVPFSDIYELFGGSETPKKVGDALTKMSITAKNKRIEGKLKNCRLGIKLKDFENTTQEYESDTSPEVSFADVDTVMTSPIKKNGEVVRLTAKIAELELALKAKEQVPEGCDKALKTCLETKSETVKTATMKKAVEGLLVKTTQLEETLAEYRQRFADYQKNFSPLSKELLDYELYEAEDKNKELVALVRYIESNMGNRFLDADGKVLPEVLEKAKDNALVDTFDTE
jgi:hypothetical protein